MGTFNQAIVRQRILDSSGTKESPGSISYQTSMSLSDFRSTEFYSSSASSYSGFFAGLLEFDVSGHLSSNPRDACPYSSLEGHRMLFAIRSHKTEIPHLVQTEGCIFSA